MATSNSKEQARVKASYDKYKKTQMIKEKAAYAAKKQKTAQQTKATAAALYATTQPKAPAKKSVVESGKSFYAPQAKKPVTKTPTKSTYSATADIKSRMIPASSVNKPSGVKVNKPVTKTANTGYGPKTKEAIKYMNPSNIAAASKKPVTKTSFKVTTSSKPSVTKTATPATKTVAKTVSQVWAEKTGTSWSEAKKQGLTDGSAKSNLALLAKLNKGEISKPNSYKATMEKNIADEMSGNTIYTSPVDSSSQTMKKGGFVKRKMKSKKK